MATKEHAVKAAGKKILETTRAWWFPPPANGYGRSGIPDVVACDPVVVTQEMVGTTIGVFKAVEYKAEDGQTTPLQDREMQRIRDAGGVAIVVRPSNLDDIRKVFSKQ